ncbi:MAG TPA: AfsR/SARP family transcriptional regulator, partial [Rugosimonospora sp.]|nr:AfsR/SARP family transcriptional regulator [Rugosimonospora sp.]
MRLLGPVDVVVDGVARPVAGLRRAGVLAALALHPGQFLGPDRLIDMVWGDTAPQGALATLRSHVSYLRRLLGQRAAIAYQPAGYQLVIGEQDTDVLVAEHLIHQATTAADPQQRERLLRDAVALWRGQPLAELAGLAWFSTAARRLDDLQRHARELLIDAQLALGEHARLIPELETLSREHPHHEPTHRQLILALYRAGRQGEALKAYQRLRHVLDDDLGISPSRALRELETAILRQDPALNLPTTAAPAIPAQARPRSA